jgi:hypothetical protein
MAWLWKWGINLCPFVINRIVWIKITVLRVDIMAGSEYEKAIKWMALEVIFVSPVTPINPECWWRGNINPAVDRKICSIQST